MTDLTCGAVTPFSVAAYALTMVSSLEPWLTQVHGVYVTAVAFPTGGDAASRTIVMTGFATFAHLLHLCM